MKHHKNIPSDVVDLTGRDPHFTSWRKATASNPSGNCVEVGQGEGTYSGFIGVRDSKNPDGPALAFTPAEWSAFLDGAKSGEFDR